MVSGTRLTNTEYMKIAEAIGARLVEAGFSVRQAVVLLSTIYSYTLSFVMEEQAVYLDPASGLPSMTSHNETPVSLLTNFQSFARAALFSSTNLIVATKRAWT